ncbi:HbrB-like protein, partial [Fistulina hepatica ATCC 64428]
NPWGALHVHVLPLFNGEPLRIPIEDLNVLVKRHIQAVVSAAPQKALATLDNDAAELIASGMVTLNSKLVGIDDSRLLSKVVEKWGFFWDQVLPYVEGV